MCVFVSALGLCLKTSCRSAALIHTQFYQSLCILKMILPFSNKAQRTHSDLHIEQEKPNAAPKDILAFQQATLSHHLENAMLKWFTINVVLRERPAGRVTLSIQGLHASSAFGVLDELRRETVFRAQRSCFEILIMASFI